MFFWGIIIIYHFHLPLGLIIRRKNISLLKEHVFFQFPLGVIFLWAKKSPPKNMHRKLNKSGESGKEMQVHLADVARFSRFCDGMWLIRVLRFFTDGSIEY